MRTAKRIEDLPPYLFASLDRKVAEARSGGADVISFGVGDPDRPTPLHIVDAAAKALRDTGTHRYPSYFGMPQLREAIAAHYERRFGVALNAHTQVLPLIGSKEGIAHLATAFVDPGDAVLVADPGYPVYEASTVLAGGRAIGIPLVEARGYLPSFETLEPSGAKVLWLNYPANPTAAVCDTSTFESAVEFCRRNEILLAHDAAYSEITYDGYVAPSALSPPGALDVAIEFGSLSKSYNMTGWRVGWAVGAEAAIEALARVKTNIDSGIFNALQQAAVAALEGPQDCLQESVSVYGRRRDLLCSALSAAGIDAARPKGSIYIWARVPPAHSSATFAEFLLEHAGVVVVPGTGYGRRGEGYVRFSLTVADELIEAGAVRIAEALSKAS